MTELSVGATIQTAIFAYGMMAVVAMLCALLIRGIVVALASAQERTKAKAAALPTPVIVSVSPLRDENAEIAAAIAAAVHAVIGAHRLIRIGEARPAYTWTSEIRSRLHTSHTPRLDRH
jgi:hypothetical protein